MSKRISAAVIFGLVLLAIGNRAYGAIYAQIPVSDDTGRDQPIDGTFNFVNEDFVGGNTHSLTARRNDNASLVGVTSEERFALEFNISSIPNGSTINSAVLRIVESNDSIDIAAGNAIQLHGYSGNGLVSVADMTVSNQLFANIANGTLNPVVQLDVTSFVQSLVSSGDDYAGFMARITGTYISGFDQYYRVIRSESSAVDWRPMLTIDFSEPSTSVVPEPASIMVWGIIIATCVVANRRVSLSAKSR